MQQQLDDVRSAVTLELEGEQLICSLMKDVVDEATELMINKHLDRVAVPYTVRCVTREMMDFIHYAFVGQDSGSVRADGWGSGQDPAAIMVDSWARGAVEVKQKVAESSASKMVIAAPTDPNTANSRTRNKIVSNASILEKKLSRYEKTVERDRLAEDKSKSTSGSTKVKKQATAGLEETTQEDVQPMSPEEVEYAMRVKAEMKKKSDTRLLSEKISKQMDELKNVKDVIVDGTTGKVIAVKTFDTKASNDRNPRKAELRYSVPQAPDAVEPSEKKAEKGNPRRGAPTAGAPAGARRGKRDGSEFVQEENTTGPMVVDVVPSGGVVVKEGDVTKRGDLKVPKSKISRQEFKKMIDTHINQPLDGDEDEAGEGSSGPKKKELVAGKGSPRKDPDNPSVSIISPAGPDPRAPVKEVPKAEFKTQKVAALPPSLRSDAAQNKVKQSIQMKASIKEVAELNQKNVSSLRVRTGVVVHQALLEEDQE
jgi:hypothetical protein